LLFGTFATPLPLAHGLINDCFPKKMPLPTPTPIHHCFLPWIGVLSFRCGCYKRYSLASLSRSRVIAVTAEPPDRDSNILCAWWSV